MYILEKLFAVLLGSVAGYVLGLIILALMKYVFGF